MSLHVPDHALQNLAHFARPQMAEPRPAELAVLLEPGAIHGDDVEVWIEPQSRTTFSARRQLGFVSRTQLERSAFHEIGIRMALGAARADALRSVVGGGLRLEPLLAVLGDEFADRGDQLAGYFHDGLTGSFEGGFVLGDRLCFRLRLVASEDLLDSFFVPSGRQSVLGHLVTSSCPDGAYRPSGAYLREYTP